MKINFMSYQKMLEAVQVSGTIDGEGFGWEWDSWNEKPFERRQTLLAELLENLPMGIVDSAPILTDVRTRDGFLRTFYDLVEAGETETVKAHLKGLLVFAQGSTGEVRGMCLTVWAGCAWLLGNSNALKAISSGEPLDVVGTISLWQLLDIAQRHNVPSSVWGSSLKAVSLEACLTGAV
jgi:hypothetical protein